MRTRALLASGLIALFLLGSAALPSQAENKKFEGTIAMPNPVPSDDDYAALACGDDAGGPLNGITYAWIDMGADYTKFDMTGPARLFEDPAGLGIGDYDLDLYFFDAECKNITNHTNGPESFVKTSTKKPARFALIIYWTGIHPEQPYVLEASN